MCAKYSQKRGTAQTGITTRFDQPYRDARTWSEKRHCPNGHYDPGASRLPRQGLCPSEKRHCPNGHYDCHCLPARRRQTRCVRKEALPKRALRPCGRRRWTSISIYVRKEALPKRALRRMMNRMNSLRFIGVRKEALPKRALRLNARNWPRLATAKSQKRGTAQTGITTILYPPQTSSQT